MAQLAKAAFQLIKRNNLLKCDCETAEADFRANGFEFAGGDYNLAEVRDALQSGFPVLCMIQREPGALYLVGEDDNYFVAMLSNGKRYTIPEAELAQEYTGRSIILTDVTGAQRASSAVRETIDVLIYTPEQDSWPAEYAHSKEVAKDVLVGLRNLDLCQQPAHPMIVTFKEPSDKQEKDHIQGYLQGVQAFICDYSCPVDVVLHELGHLYWQTRMNDAQRAEWQELRDSFKDMPRPPAIFTADWYWKNGEEVFCTVYLWFAKSVLLSKGYYTILHNQCPRACALLDEVFTSVDAQYRNAEAWTKAEKDIAKWLDYAARAKAFNVQGRLVKGRLSIAEPPALQLPATVARTVLARHKSTNREWVRIDSGLLKGRLLIFRDGRLDLPELKARPVALPKRGRLG